MYDDKVAVDPLSSRMRTAMSIKQRSNAVERLRNAMEFLQYRQL
jgi:hypothetical protein